MWNDLVQQRHNRDHCALGRQPEAAQSLEMLDRSHRCLPPTLPLLSDTIAAIAPPEQGVRERTEPFKIAAFRASNNFSPLPAALQGAGNGGLFPVPRDCWRLAKSGMTRCEVTREDHDHNV